MHDNLKGLLQLLSCTQCEMQFMTTAMKCAPPNLSFDHNIPVPEARLQRMTCMHAVRVP